MRSLAEARIKRLKALELAAQGQSFEEIAQGVGYSHRGSAHRAVFKALDEREAVEVDFLRAMESDRLDAMLNALWPRIEEGDVEAINAALRITDRRMRLMGLTAANATPRPQDSFVSLVVGPVEGNPEKATMEDVYRWSDEARRGATCSVDVDRRIDSA